MALQALPQASAVLMSVYVDNMHEVPLGQFGRMKMSHMIADTTEELLAMADKIGVARRWLQKPGEPGEHFDIAKSKRALAIEHGAIEITMREFVQKVRAKARKT